VAEANLDALVAARETPEFREIDLRREECRQNARREIDAAGVHPWRTDHPGGPVPAW
jgi:hypothetical protein